VRPVQTSASARVAEPESLPQFEVYDLSDLLELEDESDELTIRRDFSPKSPPRVAIEVTDADATWKWQAPRADAIGKFAGLNLPLLDGKQALEFDPSEVEVTREMVSPFAMIEVAKAMELRRRAKPRVAAKPVKKVDRRPLAIAVCAVLAIALVAAIAFVVRRPNAPIAMRMNRLPLVEAPTLELPPIPAATSGAIVPTVKGHRLYVDGKLIGDSAGAVSLPCGQHTIKLGTAGATKDIAVPCGGEVAVSP
jgi:hypothetical protein